MGGGLSWKLFLLHLERSKNFCVKGLEKLLLEVVDKRRVRSGHRHRAHPPSTNLAVSILSTDSRGYFGRAAGVLDADAGDAREENDGDQAAEEEPGEDNCLMLFFGPIL